MLGRGGSPLGNVVGSGGSTPGFGRLGKDGNGREEKGIGGIAVGIVGTEGMLGRGGSPVGNVVGSGGSAPGHGNDGRDGVGRLGKDDKAIKNAKAKQLKEAIFVERFRNK
ncbi:hypothetical protein Gotur_026733 [Gossypium turneri]